MKHTYFKVCEYCGAHLDPAEKCDCEEARRDRLHPFQDRDEAQPKSA